LGRAQKDSGATLNPLLIGKHDSLNIYARLLTQGAKEPGQVLKKSVAVSYE
jgi:hypothetical protein